MLAVASVGSFAAAGGLVLGGCGSEREQTPDASPQVDAKPVDLGTPGAERGSFQLTYYWVTAEEDFTGTADTSIYDPSGALLDTVPAAFVSSLDTEGTGRLRDGRVLNVAGSCVGHAHCYQAVDAQHPWGVGVQDRALVPFRTIAVDPKVIPYGTPLYIPELDGVAMPGDASWGGFVHDGCVIAGDTGGAIVGMHIDFFAALHTDYAAIDHRLGLDHITIRDAGTRCH